MKKILTVLAVIMVVAAFMGQAVAQTAPRVRVDASSVTGLAAGGAETAARAEAGVAELRDMLSHTQAALGQAQRDIRVAKGIGGAALARAKKVEAALAAKVAELEGKLASEATKAQAEVDKAAVEATVKIVGIQHGIQQPPAPVDAVAHVTDPAATTTAVPTATGLERVACAVGTTYRRITVIEGVLHTGYREECLPIPGYISPIAAQAEKPRTMPLWLKYTAFVAGGAAIGGTATYGANELGDGAGGAGAIVAGSFTGAVVGGVICALTEL